MQCELGNYLVVFDVCLEITRCKVQSCICTKCALKLPGVKCKVVFDVCLEITWIKVQSLYKVCLEITRLFTMCV